MLTNTLIQNWMILPDNKEEYKSQETEINIRTISILLSM